MRSCGDSLEATGSGRPYRPSFEWEEIIAAPKEGAGSQWDPQVVEAALKMLGKNSYGFCLTYLALPQEGRVFFL